jgi:membrane-bound ClpP family serine protease
MDMYMLILAVFLYFISAALIVAEVILPSAGLITVASIICVGAGVAIFFTQGGPAVGWVGVGVAIVMYPVVFAAAYHMLPKMKLGKSMTLTPPAPQQGGGIPDSEKLNRLIGARAVVISPMRPVGICDFSGERLECVAESGYVEKGKTVQVIDVTGTQLTVRVIEPA